MIKAEDIENKQDDISCECEDIQFPEPPPDRSFYVKYNPTHGSCLHEPRKAM